MTADQIPHDPEKLYAYLSSLVNHDELGVVHWVSSDDDDNIEHIEYCGDCVVDKRDEVHAKLVASGHEDPYVSIGGNDASIESDAPPECSACGKTLHYVPTDYCMQESMQNLLGYIKETPLSEWSQGMLYELEQTIDEVNRTIAYSDFDEKLIVPATERKAFLMEFVALAKLEDAPTPTPPTKPRRI